MSFPKFVSMITTGGIWFSNVEVIARQDPFEGLLPYGNYSHRKWLSQKDVPEEELRKIKSGRYTRKAESEETIMDKINGEKSIRELRIRQAFDGRKQFLVNCWHLSNYESAAMWKVYGRDDDSVAIISDYGRMREVLAGVDATLYCGKVAYLDYHSDSVDLSNSFYPVLRKRKSFEYEQEVRLVHVDGNVTHHIYTDVEVAGQLYSRFAVPRSEDEMRDYKMMIGTNVACDLNVLIKEIKISPAAENWFERSVLKCCEMAGLKMPASKSDLLASPIK